jgi:predicted methyltransferase
MKKEKKELIKKFKVVIEDLMDNYEDYTESEKAQIREVFEMVANLNKLLDKYDFDSCDLGACNNDKKSHWDEFVDAYGHYFNLNNY